MDVTWRGAVGRLLRGRVEKCGDASLISRDQLLNNDLGLFAQTLLPWSASRCELFGMTSWFERGRPAIFRALNDVCERIDNELLAELRGNPEPEDSGHSNHEDVDSLREENTELRAQLVALTGKSTAVSVNQSHGGRAQPPFGTVAPSTSKLDAAVSSDDGQDWKSEHIKLSKRFSALSENFKLAKEALTKRRDERDQWVQHAALLEKKIKAAEEGYGIQILDRGSRRAQAMTHLAARNDGLKPSPSASFASLDGGGGEQDITELTAGAITVFKTPGSLALEPQSDNTQGDAEDESGDKLPVLPADTEDGVMQIKKEPSSDVPVVVSERMVRKRKHASEESETNTVRRVKVEPNVGSSPLRVLSHYDFNPQESIDLGDVPQRIITPRKRKEMEASHKLEEAELAALTTPISLLVKPDPHPQSVQISRRSSVLAPVSANRRIFRSGGDKPQARPLRAGLDRGIAFLAEDGALYGMDATGLKPKASSAKEPITKGRLDMLLDNPSPGNQSFRSRQNQQRSNEPPATELDLPIPGRRELPFEKALRQSGDADAITSSDLRKTLSGSKTPVRDQRAMKSERKGPKSALRNKDVSELRLDDFKINAEANEGHDFAFSEVIRDKDERACLPGCTDMHCCGKQFRALAVSQKPNQPLSAAQRQEEQKLLEDFLGDNSYRLATMTKEERAELWIVAKTQELANKYGKHRHRFSRMRSPPGFWNADFPDTQDLEAERAEAAKREKATVEERYRDARRTGGRWVFRDE